MSHFSDCLKLAKFFARYQNNKTIDKACFRLAMAFYPPTLEFTRLVGEGLPRMENGDALLAYGATMLAAYEVNPMLPLDAEMKAVVEKANSQNWGLPAPLFDGVTAPDAAQVTVLRSLAQSQDTSRFTQTQLDFAREFKAAMGRLLAISKREEAEMPLDLDKPELPQLAPPSESTAAPHQEASEEEAKDAKEAAQSGPQRGSSPKGLQLSDELKAVQRALNAQLLDQPLTISALVDELQARAWGLTNAQLPALFLAVGPASSGKTLMSNILAQAMPDRPRIVLNMASFTGRNEGFGLTGLRYGYDSAAPGRLTSFVRENPNALVFLEHFDRAHPNVQNLLLPLLTEGSLSDDYGFGPDAGKGRPSERVVSFRDAIVVFTTARAEPIFERRDYLDLYANQPDTLISLLRQEVSSQPAGDTGAAMAKASSDEPPVRSELALALGQCRLLPFRPLGLTSLAQIARRSIDHFQRKLQSRGVAVEWDEVDALTKLLVLSQGPEVNPQELENAATRAWLGPFMQAANEAAELSQLRVRIQDPAHLLADLNNLPPAQLMADLFRRSQRLKFVIEPSREGNQLTLSLAHLGLERVQRSGDAGRDGGISIVMPDLKFQQIFGHTHIKDRLSEVVRLLQQSQSQASSAISLPRGMLLYGRPGTGKTMLAKALAAEAELPFIAVTGPQLLDIRLIKTVFRRARQYAPSLVFMDEIDALGVRGKGGSDEAINQLLTEIDGFEEARDGHVFVIAATNFPNKVDPALTRSGRLDLCLEVPLLDPDARRHFLARLSTLPHLQDWDLDSLVELSAGMSGADLEKLLREATLDVIRRPRAVITQLDLLELLNAIKYGARVERPRLKQQLESTAYHEAGHAVVSLILNPTVRIEQVTIVSRGDALGFTAYAEDSMGTRNLNRQAVLHLMAVALGGRVAQSQRFPAQVDDGGDDAGAGSDLEKATRLGWRAVTEWGLDADFGWLSLSAWGDDAPPDLLHKASQRTQAWLAEAQLLTQTTVRENWALIERLAGHLVAHEVIDGEGLRKLRADLGGAV